MLHQLQNENLCFSLREENGSLSAELTDLQSGQTWGPSVPFVLEAYSPLLQDTDVVPQPQMRVASGNGWLEVVGLFQNAYTNVGATVRFALDEGELVARLAPDRIREERPEVSLLESVHILPAFMRVEAGQGGHLVLPLRQGALCYPDRHQRARDKFLIYGEQRRWELLPLLPCCGAVRPNAALMALVESGDCDAECRIEMDGHGAGGVSFAARFRYTPLDPVDPIERAFRFVPLRAQDAGYQGMGRRLNRHLRQVSERGTLEARCAQNPELDYASSAFVLKIMHGCKEIGLSDGSGEFHLYTTCEEAMAQLALLKHCGIERVWVQATGWNPEGHDGKWPTRFPIEPRIGGDQGFCDMVAFGQKLGFQMQVHDNYLDNYPRSEEFDESQCIGSLYGGPLKRGCWGGGLMFAGWGLSFPEPRLFEPMQKLRDEMGVRGTFYVDDMGMPLELSYNLQHGPARYRRACAEGINRILRAGRTVFGSCGTENGYMCHIPDSDYISSVWLAFPSTPPTDYADETVPLWLMAVKGFVFSNLNDTFNACVNAPSQSAWTVTRRMLTMAEFGLAPRNETVAVSNPWWCYPIEETIEAMKLEYDLMIKTIPGTIRAALEDHEVLQGEAGSWNRVTRSRFSDGTETICDYRSNRLTINGQEYPLPNDFEKRGPLPLWSRSPRFEAEKLQLLASARSVVES